MSNSILVLENVSKSYRTVGNWLSEPHYVTAVDNISLTIQSGQIYGLVGESGSGKSTLARLILALEKPDSGRVEINGQNIHVISGQLLRTLRSKVQMIFQDPTSALDPSQTVEKAISEPLLNFTNMKHSARKQQVLELLKHVQLPERLINAYPHQLSGGEKQRVCIARALAIQPKLMILDEPTSALDKSIQINILNLLKNLQQQHGLTFLLISHDLAVINYLCTHIGIIRNGKIIEEGCRKQIMISCKNPYTNQLIETAKLMNNFL